MNGTTAYVLSKKYVEDTSISLGAVKGAPCTIKSQTETDDSYIVTFEWTGTSGAKETSQLTIKKPKDGVDGLPGKNGKDGLNGKDGSDGIGISKIEKIGTVDLVDTYRITFTDSSTFDYEVKNGKDGQGGSGGDTYTGTSAVNLGGIKNNQVFDKTPLPDVIDMLLHPYEKPTMTLGINPVKTIYDTVSETLSSITINANVTKKSENIKEVRFYVDNVLVKTDTTHPTGGLVSYTHTFSPATNKTFNVKIECEDIKGTSSKISANTNVYFVGQSYYGVIEDDGSDFTITETLIKGLSETSLKIKKALTYKNINATFGRIVYAYPKNLPTGGELTSIKDQGTGWSVFDSYAKQEVTVDGIIYICYYLIDPAGFDGVTMIFA